MLAAKAVITCTDSGGSLEFVIDQTTGLVTEPMPTQLAKAMDQLWDDRALAQRLGVAGRDHYDSLDISWANVVQRLLA
jgi:glycosyltransferase involved in cell wall biosynthesis